MKKIGSTLRCHIFLNRKIVVVKIIFIKGEAYRLLVPMWLYSCPTHDQAFKMGSYSLLDIHIVLNAQMAKAARSNL